MNKSDQKLMEDLYTPGNNRSHLYPNSYYKRNQIKPSAIVCNFVVKETEWFVMCPFEQFFTRDINDIIKERVDKKVKDEGDMPLGEHLHSRVRKQDLGISELTPDNFEEWAEWCRRTYNLEYHKMDFGRIPYKIDIKIDLDQKHFYIRECVYSYLMNSATVRLGARLYGYTWDIVPDLVEEEPA